MYRKTVLKNDLRVVSHPVKDRESVAIGIWVGSGGRHENDQNKGAAHFLEHILFKGSQHYNCEEIKKKIEGVGGALNAFTSEEQTCYYAKVPARHVPRTLDILADMVFLPLLAQKDFEREKGVILEEIKMYHDLPQSYVLELLDELVWPNHPLGKNLAGTLETVGGMRVEDLREFHRGNYFPGNIVVAASGRLDHEELVERVFRKSAQFETSAPIDFVEAQNEQKNPQGKFYRKETEQMHLALGMLGFDYEHKDKYALGILNIILGGNMSSRLFDEVREKRGLAYSIGSSAKFLRDTGMFFVRAGVDNTKIVEALDVILKELKKIKRDGFSRDEFTRAKDYILGQLVLGLEDTLDHMFWIGESMICRNQVRTVQSVVKSVEKVKMEDILRVAHAVLKEEKFNLSLVGPLTESQERQLSGLVGVRASSQGA